MATEWYYAKDNQTIGPISESELRQRASTGQIAPTDLVWTHGMLQWATASRVHGLLAAVSVPPPLPFTTTTSASSETGTSKPTVIDRDSNYDLDDDLIDRDSDYDPDDDFRPSSGTSKPIVIDRDMELEKKLNMSLAELNLSVRATNCLESVGINTVRDLMVRTEDHLLQIRNFGETTLDEVRERLSEIGLRLGMLNESVEKLDDAAAYRIRAESHLMRDDYDQAIWDATEAIRLDPTDAVAWAIRACSHLMKDNYHDVIVDATEAIRLDPNDATGTTYSCRAEAHQNQGNHDQAKADESEHIRLHPNTTVLSDTTASVVLDLDGEQKPKQSVKALTQDKRRLDELLPDELLLDYKPPVLETPTAPSGQAFNAQATASKTPQATPLKNIDNKYFIRRKGPFEGPFTFEDLVDLTLAGKLVPYDKIHALGKLQSAGEIHRLFDKLVLRKANALLKMGDLKSLQDAFHNLSQSINDPQGCRDPDVWWTRGQCQQKMAMLSDDLDNVILLFQSAERDLSQSVLAFPHEYSWRIRKNKWFPQHRRYLPAYKDFLASFSPDNTNDSDSLAILAAANALRGMGREAAEVIPELKAALPCLTIFKQQLEAAIHRISQGSRAESSQDIATLFAHVEHELQIYPTRQDRFDLESPLTEDDLQRSESEMVALLNDKEWAVRAKSACILRCKVQKPTLETMQALFEHLGPKEKRGNVRGQCALTLAHFAAEGVIQNRMFDRLITALIELVNCDSAWAVQAIAAEALVGIAPNLTEVVASLISALSKPKLNLNLVRALVIALGRCGPDARIALPLILGFTPHPEDATGEVVKAAAIVGIAPADHAASKIAFSVIMANRWSKSGEIQAAALNAIVTIPMDDILRKKLILERMFFTEFATIRCHAARKVIAIDEDLATKAGAYLVVDQIGCP